MKRPTPTALDTPRRPASSPTSSPGDRVHDRPVSRDRDGSADRCSRRRRPLAATALAGVLVLLAGLTLAVPPQALADPTSAYAEASSAVRSLRSEQRQIESAIAEHEARLDKTRARMAMMNLDLRRAEGEYEQAYAGFSRSLVAMYKMRDRIYWMELIDHLGLESMSSEYEFFSRVSAEHRRLLDAVRRSEARVARMQRAISDLKSEGMISVSDLRGRRAEISAALETGAVHLEETRAAYRAAVEEQTSTAAVRPGIGGFFADANEPPKGLSPSGRTFAGLASWYGPGFQGNRTASGEVYDMYAFTCASRTLPFNTWLRVTYGGRAVFLRVNDRGPVLPERVLDLSYAGATALGFSGVAYVEAEIWSR